MIRVTAGSYVAHVVYFVSLRNRTEVHLEYSAVKHLHHAVTCAVIAPGLPEVTVLVQLVGDGDEAACIHFNEVEGLGLVPNGIPPTTAQSCIRQRGGI